MNKVKTYLQGVNQKTLVKVDLHPGYLPIYSPDRRVELPEGAFVEMIRLYKRGAVDNKFCIVISFPWDAKLQKTCQYIIRPTKYKPVTIPLVVKELEAVFNFEHKTVTGDRVEVYPEFIKKVLTQEELKYAFKKRVHDDVNPKLIKWWTMWKALFTSYEVHQVYQRTTYYIQAYGTNPVAAVPEYPVYVNTDVSEPKEVTKIEIRKRVRVFGI
ncbi:hypothetical protein HN803_07620 [candidate division WWE3 bacterium]|nr:hypothetical protein [candidate division WWE3 bacterium]